MATIQLENLSAENAIPHTIHWTRERYYKMAEMGWFDGKRVELIEGEIVEMSPIGSAHATAVTLVQKSLQRIISDKNFIRVQMPVSVEIQSEPEPDISIISGGIRDYATAHPTTALLIVEVSDTTLRLDRNAKARIYAKAGVQEYWILNLSQKQLEVHRSPRKLESGYQYAETRILTEQDKITPLFAPQASISVAEMLP